MESFSMTDGEDTSIASSNRFSRRASIHAPVMDRAEPRSKPETGTQEALKDLLDRTPAAGKENDSAMPSFATLFGEKETTVEQFSNMEAFSGIPSNVTLGSLVEETALPSDALVSPAQSDKASATEADGCKSDSLQASQIDHVLKEILGCDDAS